MGNSVSGFLRGAAVMAALLFVLCGSKPASAATCFADIGSCYTYAATTDSYWTMWLTGMDCELTWADCVRRALIGR